MDVISRTKSALEIYNRLVDEESRAIFRARLEYIYDNDFEKLAETLWLVSSKKEIKSELFNKYYYTHDREKNVIFGTGKYGRRNKEFLMELGLHISFFCDNNMEKVGKTIDGLHVLSVEEVCQNYKDYTVIPSSLLSQKDMFDQLIKMGFPYENILYFPDGEVTISMGNQYFDYAGIRPRERNVFIDAGGYNGDTSLEFIKWCDNNYDHIYCFEPNKHCYKKINSCFSEDEKYQIINAGTWSCNTRLQFWENGASSRIVEGKTEELINTVSIDEIVKSDSVTFIKMDVEGAELESLMGASKTIQRDKPDLAICIYHNRQDCIDIPAYIMSLCPNYKFGIRHYTNKPMETVLYATVVE